MAGGRGFGRWAVRGLAARRRAAHDARRVRLVALHPGARRRRLRRRRRQVVAAGRGARLRRRPGHAPPRPHVELRVGSPTGRHRRGRRRHRHAAGRGGDPRLRAACARAGVPGAGRASGRRQLAGSRDHHPQRAADDQPARWRRSSRPTCSTRPTTISQSGTVDVLFRTSRWVEDLYLPLLPHRRRAAASWRWCKARERVRARSAPSASRSRWRAASCSASASPPRRSRRSAATTDPLRGDAVAAFIAVLVGRLVGAGQVFFVFGLALALAPGHDGGDLPHRVAAVRAWFAEKRASARWRFAGGVGARWSLALVVVTDPAATWSRALLVVAAVLALYVGIVVCLRAAACSSPTTPSRGSTSARWSGCSPPSSRPHRSPRSSPSGSSPTTRPNRARTPATRGATATSSCARSRSNQIVWPASHNAMSSAAYDFLGAEQTETIPEQLNAGDPVPDDRRLLRLRRQRPRAHEPRRRREPRRSCARSAATRRCTSSTGWARSPASPTRRARSRTSTSATTSASSAPSRRSRCSTTSTPSSSRNLTDVVVIDVEDYVQPKDLKRALIDGGLWDRVWRPSPKQFGWPTLEQMVTPEARGRQGEPAPAHRDEREAPGRGPVAARHLRRSRGRRRTRPHVDLAVQLQAEAGRDRQVVPHHQPLAASNGPPDPVAAGKMNSQKVLTQRLQQCIATAAAAPQHGRGRLHRRRATCTRRSTCTTPRSPDNRA